MTRRFPMIIDGVITSGRVCGECTACCKTHQVTEIGKPAGVWCEHCRVGKGCSVYNRRPDPCRNFKCGWLMGYGNNRLRPDRSKIIIDSGYVSGVGQLFTIWEVDKGALNNPFARRLRNQSLLNGVPVCLKFLPSSDRMGIKLYLPPGQRLRPEIKDMLFELGFDSVIHTGVKAKSN